MDAEEALAALARDLVAEAARGIAVELARSGTGAVPEVPKPAPVPPSGQPPAQPVPPPRHGAGAVHPHLGHHLLTGHHGDTISRHAYAHVPRPYQVPAPDAKDLKLAGQKQQLDDQQRQLEQASDHQHAAKELDDHGADLAEHGIPLPGTYKAMTPEETDTRHRYAADAVTAALRNGKATAAQHTLDGAGHIWAGDRAAVHRDLVHGALDDAVDVPSARRGILAGGLPHPARDRVLDGHPELDGKDYLHVDPARVTAQLAELGLVPEVKGLSPGEASALVRQEAEWVAGLLLKAALRRGKNVAVHMPMAQAGSVQEHAARLRDAGYHVHGLFTHTPVDKAADAAQAGYRRGLEKYRQQKGPGAPPALPGALAAADQGSTTANHEAFRAAREHMDSWETWDNTEGEPRRAERSGDPAGHGISSAEELRKELRR